MRDRRWLAQALVKRVAILLIILVTAAALLGAVALLGSVELPGNDGSPGGAVSSGTVTATDGSLFLDRAGQPTVVGEVGNGLADPITNVTVSVTIYEDGEAVDTRESSPLASTIPGGTAIPYEIRFAAGVDADAYTTNVTYERGSDSGTAVEVVDTREGVVAQDSVTVSGSMTNVDDTVAENPTAIVTFYDENGTVIGARTDRISSLEPDETGEFTVRYSTLGDVPSLAREYESYSVVAVDGDGE